MSVYRLCPFSNVVVVQSLSCVRLFATPWTAARQASLSITNSQSLLILMSTESVMPSNHLILCRPLLLLPLTFPSIRVFSNESVPLLRFRVSVLNFVVLLLSCLERGLHFYEFNILPLFVGLGSLGDCEF